MPFGIKFDPKSFATAFISRRAGRSLEKFLDELGIDVLNYLIINDKDLSDFIPGDTQQQIVKSMAGGNELIRMYSDDDIYTWLPERYQRFFEQKSDGQKWALRQIGFVRQLL